MSRLTEDPTIAAIATPPGPGGIGIIRISGSQSLPILQKLFSTARSPAQFISHTFRYGWIKNPETGRIIDEVLAVYMKAPKTYTREDIVEIHCHGSYIVLEEILDQIVKHGASLAQPGEFTKRAFLNGRIDLTQAEAVIELLQAQTKESLGLAMSTLQGRLNEMVGNIRHSLLSLRAIIEVAIDFPEDDVEIINATKMRDQLAREVIRPLETLISSADQGKIYREGISVVILGRPNVGKSSLLNALLKEDRAIVTATPGTTRDTIEEVLNIRGMPVRIVDTAGIRDHAEQVEEIGIERARQKLSSADLVLFLIDACEGITENDRSLYQTIEGKPLLLVLNKIDVGSMDPHQCPAEFGNHQCVAVSATQHKGIAELEQEIFKLVTKGQQWDPGHSCVPNVRQRSALKKALDSTWLITTGLGNNMSADLLAVDVQSALDHLSDIIGETTTEDVLDMIFDQFCIGK
ncbi:MAG: tRNA uridine-5-carboxymethylaminomethyl(34) synthesis GTPase MnmE [Deltaproteobacteria bacterium]|nr:tRNA uridine-5-carboxymethylaminomethyl(34) synthesis GTPase MnmE [Deltaproteobacteria bacterium]